MIKLLILLLSGLKFGKLLSTGGTMLLSVLAYSWIYGWRYALGFMLLLFAHEMGHFFAARQRGLNAGLPTFIPFVGAWVELKDLPHNAETEAYVGLAGPLVGTICATLVYFLARNEDSSLLLAIAYSGFFLNLFNLIPILPFDGGRITAVLSPKIWLLGVPVLAAMLWMRPSPILILVIILAIPSVIKAWHYNPDSEENRHYYNISREVRISYAFYYLVLLAFLAVMTNDVHEMLISLRGKNSVGLTN